MMTSRATSPSECPREVYHDIYDFSLWPVRLDAILTWGVKSAVRASAAGRTRAHLHLICAPPKSGLNPLSDLYLTEALPAFYSHPLFSGLSLHRSRDDYRAVFSDLVIDDEVNRRVYLQHEAYFESRKNSDASSTLYSKLCADHEDIQASYQQTGTLPKIGFLEDCLIDWRALQAQFPQETFWVTVQLSADEAGGKPSPATWQTFLGEAYQQLPFVRFVLLGRIQEKPPELLRQPNVVALSPLGMNLGHELTALLHSDLYLGPPGGYTPVALFSATPYAIFDCTERESRNYGIAYGTERLPQATPRQRLHYGAESTTHLLESLKRAVDETPPRSTWPGSFEVNRSPTVSRFFLGDAQVDSELADVLSPRLLALALLVEQGAYAEAREGLSKLSTSLPDFTSRWPEFKWLTGAVDSLTEKIPAEKCTDLLAQISSHCHPMRLVRRNGRYFETLLGFEGVTRDGWCEQKAKFVFAPSDRGDLVIIQIAGLATSETVHLSVTVNEQKAVPFVLRNEPTALTIPIEALSIPTRVTLQADSAFRLNDRDKTKYSYRIDGAGLTSSPPRIKIPESETLRTGV